LRIVRVRLKGSSETVGCNRTVSCAEFQESFKRKQLSGGRRTLVKTRGSELTVTIFQNPGGGTRLFEILDQHEICAPAPLRTMHSASDRTSIENRLPVRRHRQIAPEVFQLSEESIPVRGWIDQVKWSVQTRIARCVIDARRADRESPLPPCTQGTTCELGPPVTGTRNRGASSLFCL
jgi:hypothetical protein